MSRGKVGGVLAALAITLIIAGVVGMFAWIYVDLGDPEDAWPGPDGSRTVNTPSTIYWSPFPSSSP